MPKPSQLLRWYDAHARTLPWRVPPKSGGRADPYHVWLSEIMLQQTTVVTVQPYFQKFLEKWPRIEDLAVAPLDDVLTAWAGLGYYARARNLHKCAGVVVAEHGGVFPDSEDALLKLPGIGPYTAAAIAAIAFDKKATVVDGNVERVMARLFAIKAPMPASKPLLKEKAASLMPNKRPGDYAQGVMDLGATICTPTKPACALCPWHKACEARALGIAESLPKRAPKKQKPIRRGTAFFIRNKAGEILLRQRPEKGLLAKMIEVPSSGWVVDGAFGDMTAVPLPNLTWQKLDGHVAHTFTHFHLELEVHVATTEKSVDGAFWVAEDGLDDVALPSLMRKVINKAIVDGA
ncbi:MAG: A/G-specific adenine glycosylase [Alphaproteobacteria bacterium]